ncbi:hypothetical protein FH039_11460 [Thermococcus indicus]|uniref:Cardiolipin synthase N-terminal domain-containing protein n=1 Tax=Thermococcus indicus TaxID=2586643 RepID=A0A4Y5SPA1_9EURY|nr:PLDc N-terminal domain-containing protein [Thermococcus indicus]QDA32089.1 hypothetical protein FH039_11460 [Thermococcus indicus]
MDEMAFFGLVYVAGMLLMVLQLLALVWVIYDVTTKQTKMSGVEKVLWIVLTFLFTILGALVYYLVVKRGRRYEEGEIDAGEIRVC